MNLVNELNRLATDLSTALLDLKKISEHYTVTPTRHGQECPCCGKNVQLSRTTVNSDMVNMLMLLSERGHLTPQDWAQKAVDAGYNYAGNANRAKLQHFKLAERRGDFWYITPHGRAFLAGNAKVPRYVETYNKQVVGQSNETMSIHEVRNFDYSEI